KFENKELVGIEKYNFIDNNQLEITYNLKTADDRYRLTVLKQTYLINFINDKTNKTEIFIQWNKELIKEKIRNNSEYRFFKWLFSSFTSAITNKESEKQVLNFNYAYFDNKWLTIYAELKKEYADKYYLTNNEFKIEAIFKPVDLFDDRFEPKMINLKGETREEQ
ncbi:Mbov_0399 family ICE element protein, partial [Metamycoplasma hominis]